MVRAPEERTAKVMGSLVEPVQRERVPGVRTRRAMGTLVG
jgi:hypothetical protein